MTLNFFKSFLICLGLTGLTTLIKLAASTSPILSQASPSATQPDKVTFSCREIFDEASKESIPATLAWNPERQGNVRFIGWKSEAFAQSGWTPQKRCQEVTEKFQELYSQERLNYISHGMNNGLPIICGFAAQGETCNATNQLFTLKSNSDPKIVLQQLMDIAEGKVGPNAIIYEGSGKQMYIPVENFLKQAPLMKQGN